MTPVSLSDLESSPYRVRERRADRVAGWVVVIVSALFVDYLLAIAAVVCLFLGGWFAALALAVGLVGGSGLMITVGRRRRRAPARGPRTSRIPAGELLEVAGWTLVLAPVIAFLAAFLTSG